MLKKEISTGKWICLFCLPLIGWIQMINFSRLFGPSANKDAKLLMLYSHGDTWIQILRVYYFYEVFRKESLVFFSPELESSVGSAVNGKGDSRNV